jgi:hypothetical protein
LCIFLLDLCGLLEGGQGIFLLLKGGLGVAHCRFLLLEGFALLLEGPGDCGDGCLLALELGLLALELGLLALELSLLLLECRPSSLQLSSLRLGLFGFMLRHGPLGIALAGGLRQLLL